MARKIKIDNALQKKFAQKSKKQQARQLVVYFLIVCEGEKTEPNYFKAFPKKNGKIVYDIQFDGGGISTLKVVEKAIELRDKSTQKYDRVGAVFDKDSFEANQFNSAIKKAATHGVECAWSNEAFEFWYLLHFQNRITPMDRTQYKKAIEEEINKKKKKGEASFNYEKNTPDMFDVLKKYGNQEQAIKWAKSLNNNFEGEDFANFNPSTQVFKLVEELIGQSSKLKQEIIEKHSKGE